MNLTKLALIALEDVSLKTQCFLEVFECNGYSNVAINLSGVGLCSDSSLSKRLPLVQAVDLIGYLNFMGAVFRSDGKYVCVCFPDLPVYLIERQIFSHLGELASLECYRYLLDQKFNLSFATDFTECSDPDDNTYNVFTFKHGKCH